MNFEKYKHENGVYYAWYEVEIEFLETTVPETAPYLPKDKDGKVIPTKLKDYLIQYTVSYDGKYAIILLSAKQAEYGRQEGVKADGLQLWANFLPAFGKPIDKMMDREQMQELLRSERYKTTRYKSNEEEV